jgi:hypothetical protein
MARMLRPVCGAGQAAPPPLSVARGGDVQARTARMGGIHQAEHTALTPTVGWRDPSLCPHPSRPGQRTTVLLGSRTAMDGRAPKTGVGAPLQVNTLSVRDRDRPRSANSCDDD